LCPRCHPPTAISYLLVTGRRRGAQRCYGSSRQLPKGLPLETRTPPRISRPASLASRRSFRTAFFDGNQTSYATTMMMMIRRSFVVVFRWRKREPPPPEVNREQTPQNCSIEERSPRERGASVKPLGGYTYSRTRLIPGKSAGSIQCRVQAFNIPPHTPSYPPVCVRRKMNELTQKETRLL